jgi:hypothetical protein
LKQRRLSIALAAAVLAVAAAIPTLASGASAGSSATANTILMKGGKGGLRFEGPKTIVAGEDLKVLNKTNPRQVGPHTLSLVTKGSLPKTPKARQLCFTPKHICMSIAKWHGVKGNGPVKFNPAEAGAAGWDTLGNLNKTGDSWFTGESKAGTSIVQPVSVDTSAGPSRLYFLCAIHPEMQGSINVLPPPTS